MKMKSLHLVIAGMSLCFAASGGITQGQPPFQEIELLNTAAFADNPSNWQITGDAWYHPEKNVLKKETGTGILLNEPSGKEHDPIRTTMEHGNVVVEFDFMLAPGSSAAVYLQGRYGIALTDSWTENVPISQACGNIPAMSRLTGEGSPVVPAGIPPRMDLARAPGLWQNLRVVFQAPRFDAAGNKTADARFLQVLLNGIAIHEDIALPTINYPVLFDKEQATGPLVFSGNSRIALRNIRYHLFDETEKEQVVLANPISVRGVTPLIVTPASKTIIQRCFLAGEDRKLTFCAVVGEPTQIHYAINLEQGAVIRLWKGAFIDATTMWHGRGDVQLARPLGSVVELPSQPAFASLPDRNASWPDSMQQGYRFIQYRLDKQGRPTYNYSFNELEFIDRITPAEEDRLLTRSMQLTQGQPGKELWVLLAAGSRIEELEKGLYAVDDKKYYIRLADTKSPGVIHRKNNGREELLIPGSALNGQGLTWSYIW